MAEVVLEKMVKRFGDFTAVKGLDLTIRDKEFLVLLGPSGCGKTTTLRSISGLETPTEGKIYIAGEDVTKKRASQRDIAFVFQLYALYPHMTAYKNMAFPLRSQKMDKEKIAAEVMKAAKMLKIEHILDVKPKHLSGGDMQRVALGRALVRKPKVFLLDEPIGTLDAAFREEMRTELKKLHVDVGATTVYVTHDQMEAMSMGDRIAIMNAGELQQIGGPHEVYANPVNLFVAKFIGSPGMNFLNCIPKNGDGQVQLQTTTLNESIMLPPEMQDVIKKEGKTERELVLGVRPEDVRLSTKAETAHLPGEVYVVEKMGSYNIVDVKYGEEVIKVRTVPSLKVEIGDKVFFGFDMERVRLFDKETEQSIMMDYTTSEDNDG